MDPDNYKLLPPAIQKSLEEIAGRESFRTYTIQIENSLEKGNNFQGKIVNVKIEGKDVLNDKNKSLCVILKIAPTLAALREVIPVRMFYNTEIVFYTDILPKLKLLQDKYIEDHKFNFVNCYEANATEDNEYLIMDNIKVQGYNLEPRSKTLGIEHMRLAITNLAQYHSLSFALNKYYPQLVGICKSHLTNRHSYLKKAGYYLETTLSQAVMYLKQEEDRKIIKHFSENILKKIEKCLNPLTTKPYNLFCHGDCWQNNIMFKYEEGKPTSVTFLDWQLVKFGSPHIDLLHLLFSATDAKLREDHYQELLDLYYGTLKTNAQKMGYSTDDVYPEQVFKDHIKVMAPYALMYSIISANLLVREDDDIPDLEDVLKDGAVDPTKLEYSNSKAVHNFSERVSWLIKDFLALDLI